MMDRLDVKLGRLKRIIEERERYIFHKTFPKDEKQLYNHLTRHKGVIDKLKKKNVIDNHQYQLIYPVSQATSSKKFDSSLLHLLNRNFVGFKRPKTGWDDEPDQTDHSVIANLIRLKIARNKISHLTLYGTTKKSYREIYKKVKFPLLDLYCTPKDLQSIEPSLVRFKLVPTIPDFNGRKKEIKNLHKEVETAKVTSGIIGVVVSALSGTGKTELVRNYFEKNQQKCNIAWINAASMEESFRQLAQLIKIALIDEKGDEKEINTLINQVHDYFLDEKIIFVFDNYDFSKSKNLENDLIRFMPKEQNSCSIITSQVEIPHHGLKNIKLNSLSMNYCLAFVERSLGEKQDIANLRVILDYFGCNALALQQLIVYIKETNCTVIDYWRLIREDPDFLTDKNKVYKAVTLTIHRLAKENEKSYELLQQMAFLDNMELKRGFFICGQVFKNKDDCRIKQMLHETHKALLILRRYSLISIQESEEDKFSDVISFHSIVQTATMRVLLEQKESRIVFKILISYIFGKAPVNEDNLKFEDFRFFKYCYQQLVYIHQNMPEFKDDFILISKDRICDLVTIFSNQGAFKFVINLLKEIKEKNFFMGDAQERYKLDYFIGFCLYRRGDYIEANDILRETKIQQNILLGEEHPDFLLTSLAFARNFGVFGKFNEGLKLANDLYAKYVKVYGFNNPQTLITKGLIAFYTAQLGDVKKAHSMYEEVLRDQIENNGTIHTEVLLTNLNMLLLCQCQIKWYNILFCLIAPQRFYSQQFIERFTPIIKQLKRILNERIKLHGHYHPSVASVEIGLAASLASSLQMEEAWYYAKSVLCYRLMEYEENHKHVLDALLLVSNLNMIFNNENDTIVKSIQNKRESLYPDHPDVKRMKRYFIFVDLVEILTSRYAFVFYISLLVCFVAFCLAYFLQK